jgi:hypothetical protein
MYSQGCDVYLQRLRGRRANIKAHRCALLCSLASAATTLSRLVLRTQQCCKDYPRPYWKNVFHKNRECKVLLWTHNVVNDTIRMCILPDAVMSHCERIAAVFGRGLEWDFEIRRDIQDE